MAEIGGVSITIDHEFSDSLSLKSITAFRNLDADFGNDIDGTSEPVSFFDSSVSQDQFSQELQLSGTAMDDRLDWVAGLYYFKEEADDVYSTAFGPGLFGFFESLPPFSFPLAPAAVPLCFPNPPVPGVTETACAGGAGNPLNAALSFSFDGRLDTDNDSLAIYSQGTLKVSDAWSLTGGLRYTSDDKSMDAVAINPESGVTLLPQSRFSDTFDAVSGRLGAEFQASDDLLWYGAVSRGFKSGGFNGRGLNLADVTTFEPEYVWSYEIGMKSELMDRRLRLNAAAFFADYEDIQLTVATTLPNGQPSFPVQNAGEAEITGLEVELVALLSERFTLTGSLGLLDTEVTETGGSSALFVGAELEKAPERQFTLSGEYRVPLENHELALRLDYAHSSESFNDSNNTAAIARDSVDLVNARIGLRADSGAWEAALFGTNLTDERYYEAGFGAAFGVGIATYARPRQVGASLTWYFD